MPVFFAGYHIGKLHTVTHQVTQLSDVRWGNKAGLDHITHIQAADPLGIFSVCFVPFLRFCVFCVCQGDPTGLFKDIEHRYPELTGGFYTNIGTVVFGKPVSQLL